MPRRTQGSTCGDCWEDADLLLATLGEIEDERVLSISSGGEHNLHLLRGEPALLVVVDPNPLQLALFELEVAGLASLKREESASTASRPGRLGQVLISSSCRAANTRSSTKPFGW